MFLWKRANHAVQGAKGEESTGQELTQLEQEGWQVEYGLHLSKNLGDADIVCISPKQKAYVIDVKAHKGEIITDGCQLYRCVGKNKYPFEKDFIAQVIKQALQVKRQKSLRFVTPVLAFSNAKVSVKPDTLPQVHIVEKSRLAQLLKTLG